MSNKIIFNVLFASIVLLEIMLVYFVFTRLNVGFFIAVITRYYIYIERNLKMIEIN